nr:uncharacterized protein LOC106616248 [Bactrocera oleae]
MFSAKYLIVVALLVFCLFCQEVVEAHFRHELHKAAHKVDKVAHAVHKAQKVIAAGSVVAGAIADAAAA